MNIHGQLFAPSDTNELVYIAGGCFEMGAPDEVADEVSGIISDENLQSSRPRHTECIPPFYIGKYEITAKQYCQFLRELPEAEDPSDYVVVDGQGARTTIELKDGAYIPLAGFEYAPATCIPYVGARRFCDWLTTASGAIFRLPSEIEWEFLAHGLEEIEITSATSLHNVPTYLRTRYMKLAPWRDSPGVITVGNHPETVTVQGVHDLMGNATEWCGNEYFEYPSNKIVWNSENIHSLAVPSLLNIHKNFSVQMETVRRGYLFTESDSSLPPISSIWVRIRSGEMESGEKSFNSGFRVLREVKPDEEG